MTLIGYGTDRALWDMIKIVIKTQGQICVNAFALSCVLCAMLYLWILVCFNRSSLQLG